MTPCSHCGRLLEEDEIHDDHGDDCSGDPCSCDVPSCASCCRWCDREQIAELYLVIPLVFAAIVWTVALVVVVTR